MNKIMLAFIGCMLFGGFQIQASDGGGGGAAKQGSRGNVMKFFNPDSDLSEIMTQILNGNIDDARVKLNSLKDKTKSIKHLLSVLTSSEMSNVIMDQSFTAEQQTEAIQTLLDSSSININEELPNLIDQSAMGYGAFINALGKGKTNLLRRAINNDWIDVAKYLLSKGASIHPDVKEEGRNYSETPTHLAIVCGLDMGIWGKVLNKQDLLAANSLGKTPLHLEFQSKYKNDKIAEQRVVAAKQARKLLRGLKAACDETHQEFLQELNRPNGQGNTLLMLAIERENEYLLYRNGLEGRGHLGEPMGLLELGEKTDAIDQIKLSTRQINDDGLSALVLATGGLKSWSLEKKQIFFERLLAVAEHCEVFGTNQNNILFNAFVLDNPENFAKVVDKIKEVFGNDSVECMNWIAGQQKEGRTILEHLVNLDKDSYRYLVKSFYIDYSPQVKYLLQSGIVNDEMLRKALETAPQRNEKMIKILQEAQQAKVAAIKIQSVVRGRAARRVETARRVAQERQAAEQAAEAARLAAQQAETARRVAQERQAAEQAAETARLAEQAAEQAAEAARVAAEQAETARAEAQRQAAEQQAAEAARLAEQAAQQAAQQAAEAARVADAVLPKNYLQRMFDQMKGVLQVKASTKIAVTLAVFGLFAAVKYRHVLPAFGKKMLGYCGNFVRNLTAQAKTPLLTSAVAQ